jgi:hypothetical protein
MAIDLDAAVRRMRAVVRVLDEDLATAADVLRKPFPPSELSAAAWGAAESDRPAVDESFHMTKRAATAADEQARDWRSKAALARRRGEEQLAEQAERCAERAERAAKEYASESAAIEAFLIAWDARKATAESGERPTQTTTGRQR